MDICFICYWGRPNDDVFETCVNTFVKHAPKALLQVHSDDRVNDLSRDYGIRWVGVPKREVAGRRALCKIEQLQRLVHLLKNGDRLIVADADLYFLDDPFKAFEHEFDVAVTTRCHPYRWPVNGGMFFLRINKDTRAFVDFYLRQCEKPTWPALVEFRRGRPYTPDWEIGQDFLCALYSVHGAVPYMKDLTVIDVGYEYNFCPNTDLFGTPKARILIQNAYEEKTVKVLHLKSELKLCIYDDYMEDAITKRCDGRWNWKAGKK